MLVMIREQRIENGIQHHRPIAEWRLPDTDKPVGISFTQLATPDSTKVCTYEIIIVR